MNSLESNYDILKKYVSGERNFDRISLNLTDLHQATIREANLINSNFNLANLKNINLSDSCLDGSYLIRCNLQSANLKRTSFKGACLVGANLKGAYLEESKFDAADLKGVNLQQAYLYKAFLDRADLRQANLQKAVLDGAYLEGAYYDETTKFDRRFDPINAGMILFKNKPARSKKTVAIAKDCEIETSETLLELASEQNLTFNFLREDLFKDPQTIVTIFQQYNGRYYLLNKIGNLLKAKAEKFEREINQHRTDSSEK
jgi:uncharacterized protein YjbI with pentapeptide repeats